MRLLHTSDWHLGARFHDQDRAAEEDDVLDQLCHIASDEAVDVVCIAGDIFDTANPGAAEQQRYYRCLHRLRDVGVGSVVVIAGNHDNAVRIEAPRELLAALRVSVCGRLPRDAAAEEALVSLIDRAGNPCGSLLAVPYLRDGDLALAELGGDSVERYRSALAQRYQALHAALAAAPRPHVVMGHAFVAGSKLDGSERPVQVGNLAMVGAEALAGGANYLAMGHLHRPQPIAQQAHWRYSGSLLPTGFDEVDQQRSVVIAECQGSQPAQIREIALRPYRAYRRLQGGIEAVEAAIAELSEPEAEDPEPWLEALVRLDTPQPGLAHRLIAAARERGWNLVSVRRERRTGSGIERDKDLAGLREYDPLEVFRLCHREHYDSEPPAALEAAFRRLLAEVET